MHIKRKSGFKMQKRILIFLLIVLFAVMIGWIEQAFTPLLKTYVQQQAECLAADTVNQTVAAWLTENSCGDLLYIDRNTQGNIQTVRTDTVQIGKIQTSLNLAVQEKLAQDSVHTLTVPLGTLLGSHFLRGRGPNVSTRFAFASTARCKLENRFYAAGINQTQHEVWLTVTVTVYTMLPADNEPIEVNVDYCLVQTILVGEIPNVYLSQ